MKPTCKSSINTNTNENELTVSNQVRTQVHVGSIRPIKNNYLRMKTRYLLIIALFLIATRLWSANYNDISASYLGGSADNEKITGVQIQSDGTIVLAGNIGLSVINGINAVLLNGSSAGSLGTIIRLSTNGQTVLSVTKIGSSISDMDIDGLDNIYVALGTEGAIKLNAAATTVLFNVSDIDFYRVDAGQSGYCVMLGEQSALDFYGYHLIRLYNPQGTLLLQRYTDLRGADISINEQQQAFTFSGFNIDFISVSEYHLCFYQIVGFNGAVRYTGYNWKASEWVGKNPYEHTRSLVNCTGKDGKLYIGHTWTGQGYNCLERDPFNRSDYISMVATDKYQNINNMRHGEEGDTKKKLMLIRYESSDGSLLKATPFANVPSQGAGTFTLNTPGALMADRDGILYMAASSADGMPIPPTGTSIETYNPLSKAYTGGAVITIFSNDFSSRLYAATLNSKLFAAVDVRQLDGVKVIVAGGTGGSTTCHINNALQPVYGGGNIDGYYYIINSPGSISAPAAPSALSSTLITANRVLLQWNDLSTNEDGFEIQRKEGAGSFVKIATTEYNTTTFTDISVSGNVVYTYRVRALNMGDLSGWSNELIVNTPVGVLPSAPSGLSVLVINESQVSVSWNNVSGETGYLLEQRRADELYFSAVSDLAADQTNINLTELQAGTKYTYRIRAYNNDGYSLYSDSVVTVTGNLPLMEPVFPSGTVQGLCYRLYDKTTDLGNWPDFSTLPLRKSGTVSNFDVDASNDTLNENYAIQYYGYLDVPYDGTYTFTYKAEKGGMLFIDNKLVIDNSTWKWGAWQESGQIGLKAGKHRLMTEFFFTYAKGVYDPMLLLSVSHADIPLQLIPDNMLRRESGCGLTGSPPAAPSNLTLEELPGNMVKICWQDNSTDEGGFAIERTPGAEWNTYDRFKEIVRVYDNVTCYYNQHMINDTFEYRVRAFNAYGFSGYTEIDSIIVAGIPGQAPAPPDYLDINYTADDKINLIWRDNSYNETGFIIEYKTESGSFIPAGNAGTNINSYTVQGLSQNTVYTFRVAAYNSYDTSSWSNIISDTTLITAVTEVTPYYSAFIYPNPAGEFVVINPSSNHRCDVVIHNPEGLTVRQISGVAGTIRVNISSLPSGVYFVAIRMGERREVYRLVKI